VDKVFSPVAAGIKAPFGLPAAARGGRQARLFNFSRGDNDSSRFHHQAKTVRKTLDLNCFVTSLWLFICEE
jgi:hypothetical protein